MHSGKIITLSVWLMISLNLLLGFGAVWSFQRMGTPESQTLEGDLVTLEACENMILALTGGKSDIDGFRKALAAAENNITEKNGKEILLRIRDGFAALERGDEGARKEILRQIAKLSFYGREAILTFAEETRQDRRAGAWGVVFMTFLFFIAALFFEQRLRRAFLIPMQEIASVLEAHRAGDRFRRCNGADASRDMKEIFKSINALLDGSDREKSRDE